MHAIKTENSNHDFGPPPGKENVITSLPCQVESAVAEFGGGEVVWSVWTMTDEERQMIASGTNLKLGVGWIGAFPPVLITVTDEKALTDEPAKT